MALASMMERISNFLPNPDPAIQKRAERAQPLRTELIRTIRTVWAIVFVGLVAFRLWMGIRFLDVLLGVAFPAFWLLGCGARSSPLRARRCW